MYSLTSFMNKDIYSMDVVFDLFFIFSMIFHDFWKKKFKQAQGLYHDSYKIIYLQWYKIHI